MKLFKRKTGLAEWLTMVERLPNKPEALSSSPIFTTKKKKKKKSN
jgi:hypothetical protein